MTAFKQFDKALKGLRVHLLDETGQLMDLFARDLGGSGAIDTRLRVVAATQVPGKCAGGDTRQAQRTEGPQQTRDQPGTKRQVRPLKETSHEPGNRG